MNPSSNPANVTLSVFFLVLAISATVTCFPNGQPPLPLSARVVHQFPKPTWVENLAVRLNGQLLVTLLTTPDLYLIDPLDLQQRATLVHSFPSVLGLTAITEVELDVFYVAGGNLSLAKLTNTPGTYAVWEVDMRFFSISGAIVRKVTDIPGAGFLNGAVTLSTNEPNPSILIADSAKGGVWKVNVKTGDFSFAIADPSMSPVVTERFGFVGIDGVKIYNGYLYYTNFNQGVFYRIPISTSGTATGKAEVVAVGAGPGVGLDDFAFDRKGRVWMAEDTANLVSLVLDGTFLPVVGATDQLTVAGVTSCAFGRLLGNLLYCTTSGGLIAPVNGTVVEGGKVVVIDTSGFY